MQPPYEVARRQAVGTRVIGVILTLAVVHVVSPALGLAQSATGGLPDLSSLPRATMTFDAPRGLLILDLPPTDLAGATPGGMSMVSSPVYQANVPVSCTIHSSRALVLDSAGAELPKVFLHHVHLSDPDHRDLFLAGTLHLLAASKETPSVAVPALILGLPLAQGQRRS